MKSNNPIFNRSEEFNRPSNAYGNPTYPGNGQASSPSTWGVGAPSAPSAPGGYGGVGLPPTHERATTGPMTIDSVVQKTAISLAVVIATAAATWAVTPTISGTLAQTSNVNTLYTLTIVGSLVAFALSMANSFKRVISPALVLLFCAAEGVALGGLSKFFDAAYSQGGSHSLVTGAVIGTFGAFGGTLAAYKFFNIKVTDKFRTGVIAAVFGMVGLSLVSLVLSLFGVNSGLFGLGALGFLTAVAGLVLGVFMLILDFDFVEQGIRNGIPESESWRAAFALTVSLVWIYTNLLRLMAIFRN